MHEPNSSVDSCVICYIYNCYLVSIAMVKVFSTLTLFVLCNVTNLFYRTCPQSNDMHVSCAGITYFGKTCLLTAAHALSWLEQSITGKQLKVHYSVELREAGCSWNSHVHFTTFLNHFQISAEVQWFQRNAWWLIMFLLK